MPECYTHVHLATQALMRSGNTVASHPAFIAGANGPDPFFMYHAWTRRRKPNLPALAARMHSEKTGEFLRTLIDYASTPVQQSFVLGFVSHYAVDCTLNPYLASMSAPGMPYAGKDGQYKMAASLDSRLYFENYRTRTVALHAGTPVLITDDLAQVCTLLRDVIWVVYEKDIPLLALADAYHDNLTVRRLLISPTGVKRAIISAMPGAPKHMGPLTARMQLAPRMPRLPEHWKNVHTGKEMDVTLDEMLDAALHTGAICITAAMRYWLGEVSPEKLASVLGDNDYHTGMPVNLPSEEPTETAPLREELREASNDKHLA